MATREELVERAAVEVNIECEWRDQHPTECDPDLTAEMRLLATEAPRLAREIEELRAAIRNCLDYANGRQSEWGERAEKAFEFIEAIV